GGNPGSKREVQDQKDNEKREPSRGSSDGSNLYRGGGNPGSKREVQEQKDNEKREPSRGSSSSSNLYRGGGNHGSKREAQDQNDNEKREPSRYGSSGTTGNYRPGKREVQGQVPKHEPKRTAFPIYP
ncbi:13715_t:CDS:1, partial [Dentiscutata erythropus]